MQRFIEASRELRRLSEAADRAARFGRLIGILGLHALAPQDLEKMPPARRTLEQSLRLAESLTHPIFNSLLELYARYPLLPPLRDSPFSGAK